MPFTKLAFTSGGSKGIAFIGSLVKLSELGYNFDNFDTFIGTSIGSMGALSCAIGLTPIELKKYIMDTSLENMYDIRFLTFFSNYGFESTKHFMKIFQNILALKNYNKDITLKELFDKTNKHLIIVSTNLNQYEPIYFDHINYPDVKVLFAIRCSINIPILFHAIKFEGHYLTDGALTDDLPINPLNKDKTPIIHDQNEILCLRITSKPSMGEPVKFSIANFESYIYHTMFCLMNSNSRNIYLLIKNNTNSKIINIDTNDFNTTNFDINNETKSKLIDIGYNTITSGSINS